MKKIIFLLILMALSSGLLSCGGGGGSGSADLPPGENPGSPSIVQLWPSHYIAQTNAYITLYAKVLDGNGAPVPNLDVTFTNLSNVGVLSATTAKTNGSGLAQVTLSSTTSGFSTILAQVNTSQGIIRDRKSVFFSTKDVLAVSMDMDVDSLSDGNEIYNEVSDFNIFENDNDDTVEVLATVRDAGGVPVPGESVTWFADHTEVTFVRKESYTNIHGQAKAVVQVSPSSIRNTETHINIMAYAGNGAANMVSLFLKPIVPDPARSSITADPTIVEMGGTSTITVVVMTNLGVPAPDNTIVNFTTTCGRLLSFAPTTTGGIATTTFTAPLTAGTCTVSARVAGVPLGSVDITVRAMRVEPSSATICENDSTCSAGTDSATFTIYGGKAPYIVTSSNSAVIPGQSVAGNTFTVNATNNSITTDTTVTLTVQDSAGNSATASVTVINQ